MLKGRFLVDNAPWLGAGALLMLASSFGQTFFISLFAGDLRDAFGLSHGGWGGLYTLATVAAAAALIPIGRLADTVRVRTLALVVIAAYAGVCVAMALVSSAAMLAVILFGLRLCGQGMMGHIAMTAMARWFAARRGQAVAIATLGFSAGEAFFPGLTVALAGAIGWRDVWLVCAGLLIAVFAPCVFWLLRRERSPRSTVDAGSSTGLGGRHWTRAEVVRSGLFWVLTAGTVAPPLVGTAVFFQTVHIAEIKGWALIDYTVAFPFFSAAGITLSFITGWAVDRWRAVRILPIYLLPLAAGLVVLATAGPVWMAVPYMALMGMTMGGAVAVQGALWAELFGTRHLGSIRALVMAGVVFGSAIGPGVTGWLIDQGVGFETQCLWLAAYVAAVSAAFAVVARRLQ